MAIRTSDAPDAATRALQAGLQQLRGAASAAESAPKSMASRSDSVPHETWTLGLDAIRSGKGVDGAERVGWRYLIPHDNRQVAVEVNGTEGNYSFTGVNDGPFVTQMLELMRAIEPHIDEGDYEPRLLRIPALYIAALWLKERSSGADLFVPMAPTHDEVQAGRIYRKDEFEKSLAAAAEARARFTGSAKNERGG